MFFSPVADFEKISRQIEKFPGSAKIGFLLFGKSPERVCRKFSDLLIMTKYQMNFNIFSPESENPDQKFRPAGNFWM